MAALPISATTLATDPNLVSYWKLAANSTDFTDSNNGTDTSMSYGAGGFTGEATFSGSGYITLPSSANLKIAGARTILFWYNSSSATRQTLFSIGDEGDNSGDGGQYKAEVNAAGKMFFNINNGSGTDATITGSSTTVANGSDHFLAYVYDGSNLRIYLDGSSDATAVAYSSNTVYPGTSFFLLGAWEWSLGGGVQRNVNGKMYDVALFNRALSATEISNHWNGLDGAGATISVSDSSSTTESVTAQETAAPDIISVFDSVSTSENLSEGGVLHVNLARSGVRII